MNCNTLFENWQRKEIDIRALQKEHETVPRSLSAAAFTAEQQFSACFSAQPVITPVIPLSGIWTDGDGGASGPVISVNGNRITIDMSYYQRVNAVGILSDNADILVSFPDDAIYAGRLEAPATILWSNNSTWTVNSWSDS